MPEWRLLTGPAETTDMSEVLRCQPGERVGNYVLNKPIGQGAFAEVWQGVQHERPDRVVAIKIAREAEYVRQLRREARLPEISHANIVPVLDSDTTSDPPYVVMPCYPGGSLADLIKKHPHGLPEDRAERILWDILSALSAAHERFIVHRDIKPSNILLDGDGRALLADFGLSRQGETPDPRISLLQSISLERDRQTLAGTLAYMAPEVLHGAEPSPACDVYSVGVVLFEMLTGRLPQGIERPSHVRAGLSQGKTWDSLFGRACAGLGVRPADATKLAEPRVRVGGGKCDDKETTIGFSDPTPAESTQGIPHRSDGCEAHLKRARHDLARGEYDSAIVRWGIFAAMVVVWFAWFLSDGYVRWPRKNLSKAVEALDPVPQELTAINPNITSQAARDFAQERRTRKDLEERFGAPGWEKPDGSQVCYFGPGGVLLVELVGDLVVRCMFASGDKDESDIFLQKVLGYILLALAVVVVGQWVRVVAARPIRRGGSCAGAPPHPGVGDGSKRR